MPHNRYSLVIELIITALLLALLSWIGLSVDTTGDSGDSILHFLYSKYSFVHPELLLNHWAKPLFTLVSAPFSQIGFNGMIVFNCLMVALTLLFTYLTAKSFNLNYPWLVPVLILFCPLFLKLIFSGLTEYTLGLFLIVSIYFASHKRFLTASILVSFLPFIRSEGLIIIGVFGIYLILNRRYKLLPFLFTGHLVYSIVGFFHYRDLLWVFTKIPYASLDSPYGNGHILDFFHLLNYVIEKPMYLLLFLGSVSLIWKVFKNRSYLISKSEETILVYGVFFTVLLAHALFWWQGIFNSMGLPRVLIPVVPLVALIALSGLDFCLGWIKSIWFRNIILIAVVLIIIGFPFTYREEGIVFNDSLFQLPDNELIDEEIVSYLTENIDNLYDQLFYYSHCYFSIALNIDHFDDSKHRAMHRLTTETPPNGAMIIWDDWYSSTEGGIPLDQLSNDKNLVLLKEFTKQINERQIHFVLFVSEGGYIQEADQL